MLIGVLTNNTYQNDVSLLTNNYQQRIKRLFSRTSNLNKKLEDKLLNNRQYHQTDDVKQTQKGFTQYELAEIKRILSKTEDDYYGILNLNTRAELWEINKAYRTLSLRVHPDKFNGPDATKATQRLNKARDELLKKFENQSTNQRTTVPFTTTFNGNKNRQTTDIPNKSDSSTSFSSSPSDPNQKTSNNYTYLIFAFIILIIGIIIFMIFQKKRESYSSFNKKNFKKSNIRPTYETPESNDGDIRNMNEDSEPSSIQDEE